MEEKAKGASDNGDFEARVAYRKAQQDLTKKGRGRRQRGKSKEAQGGRETSNGISPKTGKRNR